MSDNLIVKNHVKIWDNCLNTIRVGINEQSFRTWFEPIRAIAINEAVLTLQVPNKFFYEFLEEHYLGILKEAIRKELGDQARLEYKILMNHLGSNQVNAIVKEEDTPNEIISAGQIKNPFVIPGIRKIKVDPQLNPQYNFNLFVEGDCNRLARQAGLAISKKPGGTAFNPLVIYGDVGLGKTHLAQAIGNSITDDFSDKIVLYVTTEKFTNQIIQSIKNNATNELVQFYQNIDVLIVDDIHFLANRTKTQEIFFNIFNQLHQNGKQIVLTTDKPPKDLNGIEERLISRFKWGLIADLQAPEFETRMAILQSKMDHEGIDLPPEVVEFICFNIQNNIRELEGVLISLIAQSSLNNQNVDLILAKETIQKFVSQISREITIDNIQDLVAKHFKLPVEKLQGKTRKRSVVMARQLAMYLAKNLTNQSLKAIGDSFGGRDHSTVIYSCKAVQDMIDTDLLFRDTVSELEKKVSMSLNSE